MVRPDLSRALTTEVAILTITFDKMTGLESQSDRPSSIITAILFLGFSLLLPSSFSNFESLSTGLAPFAQVPT
jgi:hypothetical protein